MNYSRQLANDEPGDLAIAALAGKQHGNVTRVQLLRLGLDAAAVDYRVRIGRLILLYRGVYAVGHRPTEPLGHASAAVLACGPGALLCGTSAHSLWGWRTDWRRPFEVVSRSGRTRRGIIVHRWALAYADIRIQRGIRVTSPARTVLDVAPELRTEKAINRLLITARDSNFLKMSALADVVERNPRHRGAKLLRPVLDAQRDGLARSDLELDFPAWCERHGLPQPTRNVDIAGYEIDFWFAQERVAVEVDGKPYHLNPHAFETDRERDAHHLAHDIVTVRVTKERLRMQSRREAARLMRILAQRRQRRT